MKSIDNYLNGITQYRLMLYFLISLLFVALVLSIFKLLPINPLNLFFSGILLTTVCWVTNKFFEKKFKIPTNIESVYITALILTLIMTPARTFSDLIVFTGIGFLSQACKYILAINRKHIFNPAAFGAVFAAIILNHGASWWIGNKWMLFFVILGGFLIVKKLQRFSLVLSFMATYLIAKPLTFTSNIFFESSLIFFTVVMLTEPQTTPPNKKLQIINGILIGIGYNFVIPEIALLLGNIFSYVVSPKDKLLLKLKEKIQIAPDIYEFIFQPVVKLSFLPGQYMEWTLGHNNQDSRGSRRYFTLASSPTENNLRIGVKFYPNSSSYKKNMLIMNSTQSIVAAQLSGEFTLPKETSKKLCFIAGGIGITPYRSMIKYLLDTKERRDIILIYSAKNESDFVYQDILNSVKTIYVATEKGKLIDEAMIKKEIPDFKDRFFYISGPHSMVDDFKKTLNKMNVSKIKIDFFPGYA